MADRDVIDLLRADHRTVVRLLRDWEHTPGVDDQRRLVAEIRRELLRHSAVEEQYLYPAAREYVDDSLVQRERRAHGLVEDVIARLDHTDAEDPTYHVLVRRLLNFVRNHVHDEETCLFPVLAEKMSADERRRLGEKVAAARHVAPTRPHPHAPKHPPMNKVAGVGLAAVDRIRDLAGGQR